MAAQIKNIIETLCNILNKFDFNELNPEDFRLAKYNKPQAVWCFFLLETIIVLLNLFPYSLKKCGFSCMN